MRFFGRPTLTKKTIIFTTIGLLLGITLFSFLGLGAVNEATENMLEDRVTTASLVADYLDETLEIIKNEIEHTAELIETNGFNGDSIKHVEDLSDLFSRLSVYAHRIHFIDDTGEVIWSRPGGGNTDGFHVSMYPSIIEALQTGEIVVSGLVLSPDTEIPVVLITAPVDGGHQSPSRALIVAIDIVKSSIGGFVQPIRLGQTGYTEVVDQNGIVVVRTDPGPTLAPFEKSDHSGRFAELIAAGKPTRGLCHTCHEPIQKVERRDVLAFVPVSAAKWGVVIRQSEEEALFPVYELRRNLFLSGAGLVLAILLSVVIVTHSLTNRLRSLSIASQHIADGDLGTPIQMKGNDEVSDLAQTFDNMRAKLKLSHDDLEQRTKELSSLLSVSEILTTLSDLSNIGNAVTNALNKTLEILKRNSWSILLWDEEKQMLCYWEESKPVEDKAKQDCCRLGEGISGRAAELNRTIVLKDISRDARVSGADLSLGKGVRAFASTPLRSKEKLLGVLNIASSDTRKFSREDVHFLEGVARQVAIALENARLHQEVQYKEEIRGELLNELLSIQEEERKRIAQELHDETSQVLASLNARLEAASKLLPTDATEVKELIRNAQAQSITLLEDIHKLIYELRPTLLDDLGLVAATRWLLENTLEASGINVNFQSAGRKKRLSPPLETALFRVIQEASSNIIKHSESKNVFVIITFKRNSVVVSVSDDGKGFNVADALAAKDRPRGLGLLGMKERVERFQGKFAVKSGHGRGTEVYIDIPTNTGDDNGKDKGITGR